MGATVVNVCIPVMLLWLATRRRFWSLRLLLALPAVVAVSMAGTSTLISLIPDIFQLVADISVGFRLCRGLALDRRPAARCVHGCVRLGPRPPAVEETRWCLSRARLARRPS